MYSKESETLKNTKVNKIIHTSETKKNIHVICTYDAPKVTFWISRRSTNY